MLFEKRKNWKAFSPLQNHWGFTEQIHTSHPDKTRNDSRASSIFFNVHLSTLKARIASLKIYMLWQQGSVCFTVNTSSKKSFEPLKKK